jgi:hypothetical protein
MRIFGPKRDEMLGGWGKLHNEEFHNSYSSPSIIRMIKTRGIRWAGHVARMGKKRNAYRVWWENNIKTDFRDILMRWYGLDSFGSG